MRTPSIYSPSYKIRNNIEEKMLKSIRIPTWTHDRNQLNREVWQAISQKIKTPIMKPVTSELFVKRKAII